MFLSLLSLSFAMSYKFKGLEHKSNAFLLDFTT